ncbi:GntR family transcriptional regulator [Proteiniclasticum sp. C24MP]|uniref:GntR family transcriptional regulator n=1 Tax=Proteiniclasticum sp. C24MP TaxID=3374101 RepID=UPI003754FDDD
MERNNLYKANTMGDDVYELMKKDILSLEIKPGTMITEQIICDKYGISRTPSRHVMQRLRDEGLIHSIPYKASYVSLLDFDSIRQLIYMRTAIESRVIRDAMKSKSDDLLRRLEESLKKQDKLLQGEFTPDEFYALDSEFHKNWFVETDKCIVWEEIQKLLVHYTRFRMLDIVVVKNFHAIYEEHKKIVEMIREDRFEEVEQMITKHLNGGIERLGDKIYGEYADYFIKA